MTNHYQRTLSLAGIDASALHIDDLRALVRQLLDAKIHGVSFSPYVEGQKPGTKIDSTQIRERLEIVQPYVRWIRTFSCSDGHELIPAIAAEKNLRSMVGVWLDDNHEQNELEITNAIKIAKSGHADILGIGNEVLLRGDLTEDELIDYLVRVKAAVPDVSVGYVDAYFKFKDHPRVADACDVILANCYPFWEGCPAETSLLYMKEMYRVAEKAANGKKVIVSETGWPNVGSSVGGATPSYENAIKYIINTFQWSESEGIDVFYFSSFDEAWKVAAEGDVGAYWGLWDEDGRLKYA